MNPESWLLIHNALGRMGLCVRLLDARGAVPDEVRRG
jgi:hypothetical protein